ncbi:uncharacterized protein QC761_0015020 [Podospora bellae-mahoneyi]|uniref:Uncharacterized protein n=1 Tax=Podospora bellae-mahoneyi TaxID=2093777 RepID=A0ABR0FZD3_9PEZI|nr:hypothetical protein QC761_0015020 [Podospora bellae-mahoneyi]
MQHPSRTYRTEALSSAEKTLVQKKKDPEHDAERRGKGKKDPLQNDGSGPTKGARGKKDDERWA